MRVRINKELEKEIREKLSDNGGYCPCKIPADETRCPCKEFREIKECICGLYEKY